MILKIINNIFILILFILNISCTDLEKITNKVNDLTNNDKIILSNNIEDIEKEDNISNFIKQENINYVDVYNTSYQFEWKKNNNLNKIITINNNFKLDSFNVLIYQNNVYSLEKNLTLKNYDLVNGKLYKEYKINFELKNEFAYPISLSRINNIFYANFSDGNIISFDKSGNLLWNLFFNDIVKTPIKIHNKNLIILLSNKIISINPNTLDINWQYDYTNDNPLSSEGGNILSYNQLLYFVLPNRRLGEIDTILGNKNVSLFSNINLEDSLDLDILLHNFNNLISIFDNLKYLYTLDIQENQFLVKKFIIQNISSAKYINNTLISLDRNKVLYAFNITNNKLFWKTNIKKYLSKNSEIVEIINTQNSIIIFFTTGNIIEVDLINGEILSNKDLKLNNITKINFFNDLLLVNQSNGKISIIIQ